jgi:hypothetical protein
MSASVAPSTRLKPSGSAPLWLRLAVRVSVLPWLLAAMHLAMGTVAAAQWLVTGSQAAVLQFLQIQGPLVLTALAVLEYLLCLACWRLFETGEPLRRAWFLIMSASGCRLAGLMVTTFFGWFAGRGAPAAPLEAAAPGAAVLGLASTVSRPLSTALVVLGLMAVLRLYRRSGLLRKPTVPDVVLLAVVAGLLLGQLLTPAGRLFHLAGSAGLFGTLGRVSSPLLGLLLLEALLLRRAVLWMGDGLIGRCWGAYVSAIFLAFVADVGARAVNPAVLPWQYSFVHSCIWLLSALAYALAPAYQVQAVLRARFSRVAQGAGNPAVSLPLEDHAYAIMSR